MLRTKLIESGPKPIHSSFVTAQDTSPDRTAICCSVRHGGAVGRTGLGGAKRVGSWEARLQPELFSCISELGCMAHLRTDKSCG
jgi:hypothetical protein